MLLVLVSHTGGNLHNLHIRLRQQLLGLVHANHLQIIHEAVTRMLLEGIGEKRIVHGHVVTYHRHVQITTVILPDVLLRSQKLLGNAVVFHPGA